jgi:hypothetical protein
MDWILKVDICQADTFYSTVAGTFLYYHPIFKKTKLFVKKIKKLSSSALTLKYNYEFNYPI